MDRPLDDRTKKRQAARPSRRQRNQAQQAQQPQQARRRQAAPPPQPDDAAEDLRGDWTTQDERELHAVWAGMEAERRALMTPRQRLARTRMLADLEAALAADAAAWEAERQRKYGDKKTDEQHDQ